MMYLDLLIKNKDRFIISDVIIEAAISNVTKGWPIKSFPECPNEVVQNDSTVNYARPPRNPLRQLPTIQRLIKKSFEKFNQANSGYLRARTAGAASESRFPGHQFRATQLNRR